MVPCMMERVVANTPLSDVQIRKVCAGLVAVGGSVCATQLETAADSMKEGDLHKAAMRADIVMDIAWEKLHTGPWKDVQMAWRDAYSLAALLVVQSQQLTPDSLAGTMRTLDLAVMMGGPAFRPEVDALITRVQALNSEIVSASSSEPVTSPSEVEPRAEIVCEGRSAEGSFPAIGEGLWQGGGNLREERVGPGVAAAVPPPECNAYGASGKAERLENGPDLQHLLSHTRTGPQKRSAHVVGTTEKHENGSANVGERTDHERQSKRPKPTPQVIPLPPGSNFDSASISTRHMPSLESFLCEHMLQEQPVILTGVVTQWPAFQKWQDLGYLKRVAGLRTVPVEVGETYVAEKWRQELMTLASFIERHVEGGEGPEERGYLAQHSLFEQIPELRKDIVTPDYCTLGGGEMQSVNAWFGPPGTITPLHYDPHHNLLAQVVGRKYIRLYAPPLSDAVYPHVEGMLTNTSRVDLDRPDDKEFPSFAAAPFLECVLEAGQMLYIPPRWWHYVKALSKSFSVSFWWAAE